MPRDIVVIGGSSGGLDAMKVIVRGLPADLPAAVCVVLHSAPDSPGVLGPILGQAGRLPARTVAQREKLEPGRVYVPVPDHHLIIEPGAVIAAHGPKENRFRPAVDPLFRSAAQVYGPRVIAVILTGGLDDGTAGLWTVKQLGGTTIVQDPQSAQVPSMPRSALEHVRVDHVAPLEDIAPLLADLVVGARPPAAHEVPESVAIEVAVARDDDAMEAGVMKLGTPSTYACPECHGVLLELKESGRVRFRCHTGHAYSTASLLASFDEAIEESLWNAVRALEEKMMLLGHLAGHSGQPAPAATAGADTGPMLEQAVQDTRTRTDLVRRALGSAEHT